MAFHVFWVWCMNMFHRAKHWTDLRIYSRMINRSTMMMMPPVEM